MENIITAEINKQFRSSISWKTKRFITVKFWMAQSQNR